jgi:hypothetical protein
MNTRYLIFLDTQSPLWDYAPNRQWLNARSMRIIQTNETTVHVALIETEETSQEVHDAMGETLCNVDSFNVIPIEEVVPSDDSTLLQWLNQRNDWKEWCKKHKF